MTGLPDAKNTASLRTVVLVCIAALMLVWAIVWAWTTQLRNMAMDAAGRELLSLSVLLADNTDRTLQGVDLLLSLLATKLETAIADPSNRSPAALHEILRTGLAGIPQVSRAMVFDTAGTAIADSDQPSPGPRSVADQEHFQVHRARADVGMFISDPVRERPTDDWSIVLSRRLDGADRRFIGTIAAEVRPSYFAGVFTITHETGASHATLLKRRGMALATTSTTGSPAIGQKVPVDPNYFDQPRGILSGVSPVTGIRRMAAFADARLYPVVVVISRNDALIATRSARGEAMIIGAGVLVSVLIVALGLAVSRQMRSLEWRFRDGIERMSDGFVLWDADDRLITWNSQAEKLFPAAVPLLRTGITLRELLERLVARTRPHLSPEEREAFIRTRLEICSSTEPRTLETHDGRVVEIQATVTRFGGKVTVLRDVTARKRQQDTLERALEIEREANELHRRFVAMASHEFRTPLAVIDGAAQRLLGRPLAGDSDSAGKLERIRTSVTAMTMLIDRTLSSARLEAGSIQAEMQRIDLRDAILRACERQRQISPGFEIFADLPPDDAPLLADPRLLDQVFGNLLSNAVKYSGRSRRIEVAVARVDDPTQMLRVTVRDHGIGIDADEIDRLFTRFFRARTGQGIAGTGIGLHLAQELVRLHGGRIGVESQVGEGTCFTVTLPTATATDRAAVA